MDDLDGLDQLRRMLERAGALAAGLGAEPREPAEHPRYFRTGEVKAALARASAHEGPITLVVGAGASMEAGLPSWPTLVNRLLARLAGDRFDPAIAARWADEMKGESLTAAAAVVEALSDDDIEYVDRIRSALYGGLATTAYQPQALAQQVAWLKQRLGAAVRIATGNYDGLLERALENAGLVAHPYVQRRDEAPGSAAVYHLHGRLIPGRRPGRIVLSEADYARVQQERSWQDGFMRDAFERSLCVFVGASMTDPNLIRWLYRYAPEARGDAPHIALFARQAAPEILPEVRTAVEESAQARWRRVGVDAVFADFFGEVAQFLHELGVRRIAPGVEPFADRARARFEAGREIVVPDGVDVFRRAQQQAAEFLREVLDGVRHIAGAGGVDLSGELLGLGLWGVDHESGSVGLWATSDRQFTEPAAVTYNPLEYDSRWIASEAVTRGVPLERDPRVYASRWRYVRGVPIVVPEHPAAGRVVVGALTLTSTTPQAESRLTRSREVSTEIDDHLARSGAFVFV